MVARQSWKRVGEEGEYGPSKGTASAETALGLLMMMSSSYGLLRLSKWLSKARGRGWYRRAGQTLNHWQQQQWQCQSQRDWELSALCATRLPYSHDMSRRTSILIVGEERDNG